MRLRGVAVLLGGVFVWRRYGDARVALLLGGVIV
jgi:hypothetical protein